jgi:hypothetical protein
MEPQLDAPLESAYKVYATKGEDSMNNNGVKLSGKRTEKGRERYATLFCPFLRAKKGASVLSRCSFLGKKICSEKEILVFSAILKFSKHC